jgi:hypothetical protein
VWNDLGRVRNRAVWYGRGGRSSVITVITSGLSWVAEGREEAGGFRAVGLREVCVVLAEWTSATTVSC